MLPSFFTPLWTKSARSWYWYSWLPAFLLQPNNPHPSDRKSEKVPERLQGMHPRVSPAARHHLRGLAGLGRSRRLQASFCTSFSGHGFHNPQLFCHEFPKRNSKGKHQKGEVSLTSPLAWHQFHQRAQSLSLVRCMRFTNEHRAWCSASPEVSDPDTPKKMWATTGKKVFSTSKMITLLRLQWRVPW